MTCQLPGTPIPDDILHGLTVAALFEVMYSAHRAGNLLASAQAGAVILYRMAVGSAYGDRPADRC